MDIIEPKLSNFEDIKLISFIINKNIINTININTVKRILLLLI